MAFVTRIHDLFSFYLNSARATYVFLEDFIFYSIGYIINKWDFIFSLLALWVLFVLLCERVVIQPLKQTSFYKRLKELIDKPRALVGVLLAGIGTFIVFSPNIAYWDIRYNNNMGFYEASYNALKKLSEFGPEVSEPSGRQRIKTLENGEKGFSEIISSLQEINPTRVEGKSIEKITNTRRWSTQEYSGQYLDIMNVIHVYDHLIDPPYSLVTTETDLRQYLRNRRNRDVERIGTIFIILGIFWMYLYQGTVHLISWIVDDWGERIKGKSASITHSKNRTNLGDKNMAKITNLPRFCWAIFYLLLSGIGVLILHKNMFYFEPVSNSYNLFRFIWCFSSCCFGFSMLAFSISINGKTDHKSTIPKYFTLYPALLGAFSCISFSIFNAISSTSGYIFYYASFALGFTLAILIDDFGKIVLRVCGKQGDI